jgi:PPOX class probable F420-dependent enzyme
MGEPRAAPPLIPAGYGVPADTSGAALLPWSSAAERLAGARNYWLCTTRGDGRPHAMPVWAIWLDDALWFSSGRESQKSRNLERDPRCVVHLESGDDVVVLDGDVSEEGDADAFARFADVYEQKYAYRPTADLGAVYVFRPRSAYTWHESDFPKSAARWVFRASAST